MSKESLIKYTVKYECDLLGNHISDVTELCDQAEREFSDPLQALNFIGECSASITKPKDLLPELFEIELQLPDVEATCQDLETFVANQQELGNIHLVPNGGDFKSL